MATEVNVLALVKAEHRYILVYDDFSRDAMVDHVRDMAANPEVKLNWFDAAVLSDRIRVQTADVDALADHDRRNRIDGLPDGIGE